VDAASSSSSTRGSHRATEFLNSECPSPHVKEG
jgi:hypothetical protein